MSEEFRRVQYVKIDPASPLTSLSRFPRNKALAVAAWELDGDNITSVKVKCSTGDYRWIPYSCCIPFKSSVVFVRKAVELYTTNIHLPGRK